MYYQRSQFCPLLIRLPGITRMKRTLQCTEYERQSITRPEFLLLIILSSTEGNMIWRGWGHISCMFLQWIIISSTSSKHCVETTKFQYAYFYLITRELLYIAVILILTEPRWWGNNIEKYTPNQSINIRHTD